MIFPSFSHFSHDFPQFSQVFPFFPFRSTVPRCRGAEFPQRCLRQAAEAQQGGAERQGPVEAHGGTQVDLAETPVICNS